jgi:hypothetical protein
MEVAVVGGPLKKYEVTTPSGVVTTMKLNDDDAKRLGVTADSPADEPAAEPESDTADAPTKSRATRNKARTATGDKDGGTGGGD